MMRPPRALVTIGMLLGTALLAIPVSAAEVGTIAAVGGTAELRHAGIWNPAAIGAPVNIGDEVRTGRPGQVRIVFQDDSVLAVSDGSHITVTEQYFDPTKGQARSLMQLITGKVNAIVSEYYHRAGSNYQIQTRNAVAGVRGTEFIMSYDPAADVTQVFGVSGHVVVHSAVDPTGPGVLITPDQSTSVTKDQLPTQPRQIGGMLFQQTLDNLSFIGNGRAETLALLHGVTSGASVPAADRAAAVNPPPAPGSISVPNLGKCVDVTCLVQDSPQVVKAMTGQLGISLGK